MGWFKRSKKGVITPTNEKKETPEGLWFKCPNCNNVISNEEYTDNLSTCTNCKYHGRIDSTTYFKILFDDNKFKELDANLTSTQDLLDSEPKSAKEWGKATNDPRKKKIIEI